MAFWVTWQLWEKLSFALAILIVLVIIYGFCVLMYSRWRIRRYAAIEARQKEEEAELYPMLKRDDIPFGARALERGVQVPGIWISSLDTPGPSPQLSPQPSPQPPQPPQPPQSPGTPGIRSRSPSPAPNPEPKPVPIRAGPINRSPPALHDDPVLSPVAVLRYPRPPVTQPHRDMTGPNIHRYESYRQRALYPPTTIASAPVTPGSFNRRSEPLGSHEKRASFHNRVLRASQLFDSKRSRPGTSEQEEFGLGSPIHENDSRPQSEQHRASRIYRILRRRSSEEFRRKVSQIFNDRIHMNIPAERLQFDSTLKETHRRQFRTSVLSHFRS